MSALRYRDRARTWGGIASALLRAGAQGAAGVTVKAAGPNLLPPSLPLARTQRSPCRCGATPGSVGARHSPRRRRATTPRSSQFKDTLD